MVSNVTKLRIPARTPKDYGAEYFERAKSDAGVLLSAIKTDLADVDFFTREDCLHLQAFDHVATISRYGIVREAVTYLLRYERLHALTRTELCLPIKKKFYTGRNTLEDHFTATIIRLLARIPIGRAFGVMNVVTMWTTDQHLTINTKRVLARNILRRLVKEDAVTDAGEHTYVVRR